MTGTEMGLVDPKKLPTMCLFAVSVNPLAFCPNHAEKGKIFCKGHIGKKESQEAKK